MLCIFFLGEKLLGSAVLTAVGSSYLRLVEQSHAGAAYPEVDELGPREQRNREEMHRAATSSSPGES